MIRRGLAAGIVAVLAAGWMPPPGSAAEPAAEPAETASVTTHAIDIDGRRLEYRATAGTLVLRGKENEHSGQMFYVAYQALDADPERRPVTFVFNGGPGAASAYLHLGALGPVRVVFNDDGTVPPPPARMVENAQTWLDFTDLVFVDPIGTGFSRGGSPDAKARSETWGVNQDVTTLAEFIRLYLTRNGRWLSPRFLAGESYGGIRGARLADALHQTDHNIPLNGLVFISPAFEYALLNPTHYNVLPWMLSLPSFAATALYHGRSTLTVAPDGDLAAALDDVERFAVEQFLPGLVQGTSLDPAERDRLFQRYAGYAGLPADFVEHKQGRVSPQAFGRELLRDSGRVVGIYDGTVTAIDPFPGSATLNAGDPSLQPIGWPLVSAFNVYVRQDLGYETDLPYELLNDAVVQNWDWRSGMGDQQGYVGAADNLKSVLTLNPAPHLFIAHGYYDLLTTFAATRYLIDQMALDPAIRSNVTLRTYPAGHMIYTHSVAREQLYRDVRAFYEAALPH